MTVTNQTSILYIYYYRYIIIYYIYYYIYINFSVCLLPFGLESSQLLCKDLELKTCKIIILSAVLCGYEMWSLKLREESKVRAFGKRVLKGRK
jgi:hypothetical protein